MSPDVSPGVHIRRGYAPGGGGQIHYRRAGPEGARSPLLLIHPAPSSGYVFETFMAEMGRDRLVVAPDLPGHGLSDPLATSPQIADYAGAILASEAALGLGLFDVMGYHLGSLIAAEMARQQPAAVRKIVMVSAPIFTGAEKAKFAAVHLDHSIKDRAAGFAAGWENFHTAFWKMGNDEARTWNLYLDAQHLPSAAQAAHQAAMAYDLAAALPALAQPLLVLSADDELKEQTGRARALVKNGRVHDLPGWTHGFLDGRAKESAEIVRAFLDS